MKRTVLTEVSVPRIIRVHREPSSVDWCFYFICVLIVLVICLGIPLIVMQVRFCGRGYRYITYVNEYASGSSSSESGNACFAPKCEDPAHHAKEVDVDQLNKRGLREIEKKSKIIWTKNLPEKNENKIKKKHISAAFRFKEFVAPFNDLKLATCARFEKEESIFKKNKISTTPVQHPKLP